MVVRTTYSKARATLATFLDMVTDDRETVLIRRRGRPDVALIAADELDGLLETVRLLSPPKNGIRLLTALSRAREGSESPMSLEQLRREVGLEAEG